MSIAVKRGRFTANTATGNQAVTGVGFQPKAVILLAAQRTAVGYGTHAQASVGVATSPTQRGTVVSLARNVAGAAGSTANQHADQALALRNTSGTGSAGVADLVSMDSDGFTVNWTLAPGGAYLIEYLALGGSAVQAKAGHVQHPSGTTAAQALTGLGFAPQALVLMSSGSNAAPGDGSGATATDSDGQLGFGLAARDGSRATVAHYLDSLKSPQDAGSFTSSAEALAAFNSKGTDSTTALDLELYVDSFDSDGWTARSSPAAFRAVYYHYLALAGVGAKVVTATQPSAAGNQAITGVGFQPKAVIALSAQEATGDDAASTPNTSRNLRRVLGVADAASSSCIWASAQDALVNNTDADSGQHDELMRFSSNAQVKLAGATVASFDADGITLNWNTADASGRQFRLLLIGDPPLQPVTGAGGIASDEAVGAPTVTIGARIDPVSIGSAEAVGSPAVTPGPVTIRPASIPGGEDVGAPRVTLADGPIGPVSIGSQESVGHPRVISETLGDPDFHPPKRHGLTLKWAITSLDRSAADDPEPWEQLITGSGLEGSQVEIPINDVRTATLELSVYDRMAAYVRPYSRMLKCWLAYPWDVPDLLVFWGPITQPVWNYAEGKVTVNALDPGVRLQHHFLTAADSLVDKHHGPWNGNVPIDGTGLRLLRDAGDLWPAQRAAGIPELGIADGIDRTTHENPASSDRLVIEAQPGDGVWDKMVEVSTFEGGPDFELRPFDSEPGVYALLNAWDRQGRDKTKKVLFADGNGPDNATVTYEPGPDLITYVHVRSEDGKRTLTVRSPGAAHAYGIYSSVEDLQGNVPAVNWEAILRSRGYSVLAAYSEPLKTMEVEPQPVSAYHYGMGYEIGDTVSVAGRKGYAPAIDEVVRVKKVTLAKSPEGVKETMDVVPHIDAGDLEETGTT